MNENETYGQASRGLTYLFAGQLLTILVLLPSVGWIAGLIGLVISIWGFRTLSELSAEYHTAFRLEILNLILSVIYSLISISLLDVVLSIITSLITMLVVMNVCTGTGNLLRGVDDHLAGRSDPIRRVYFLTTIALICCTLLINIPLTFTVSLAVILALAASLVQIGAAVIYMVFLWKSQKALAERADRGY